MTHLYARKQTANQPASNWVGNLSFIGPSASTLPPLGNSAPRSLDNLFVEFHNDQSKSEKQHYQLKEKLSNTNALELFALAPFLHQPGLVARLVPDTDFSSVGLCFIIPSKGGGL